MQREVRQLTRPPRHRAKLPLLSLAALTSCATVGTAPTTGWHHEAPEYAAAARLADGPGVVVGKPASLAIAVRARGGFHLNPDYPQRFTPVASAGVAYPAGRQDAEAFEREPCTAGDPASCALRLTVPFTPLAAGPVAVGGELAFGACDAERCIIEKLAIALPARVTAARPGRR